MATLFITGSADGLGQLAAQELIRQGHKVVLHARNSERGKEALTKTSGAETVLTGDLSSLEETKQLAEQVNALGNFDAIIHNAGVYQAPAKQILSINTIAPYVLTCLIHKPQRLIYLSSGMHMHGKLNLDHLDQLSYSDSKLHVLMLTFAVARKWPTVFSNGVDPGWVPTKMGGRHAPDNLQKGFETQAWLAVSDDDMARVTGKYFFHKKERHCNPIATDVSQQEKLINLLEERTGVGIPG